ncbi:MAG: 30S ribosomal protein S20 [Candidatus Caldatribacteriota bacterium]|jgi:small subunit ribosomal protein S20|nr:30S ribosomal protein S20 [Atribacterota bacterium]MDD3030984.1 30S ribosomal protein S20 [Atribacterota bacterium]MDD3640490.1 30S ribosomal protein S20 [Atribacterota bacterium]MDD4288722.1 30S ribosomal protein S20 [Atribacterota bacterium]MDD4764599.1 30S ribosomal protein S20 [Atribacterota bacterium]
MPIIKSAIKRVKISERQRLKNSAYKSKVKTLLKKFENAINSENLEDANQAHLQCVSILDKAAQKGILAKNTVSRKKSLLAKKLKNLSQINSNKNVQDSKEEKEK